LNRKSWESMLILKIFQVTNWIDFFHQFPHFPMKRNDFRAGLNMLINSTNETNNFEYSKKKYFFNSWNFPMFASILKAYPVFILISGFSTSSICLSVHAFCDLGENHMKFCYHFLFFNLLILIRGFIYLVHF
jgi:hypothetical protein